MTSYEIAVLAGSNRRESINRRLAAACTRLAPGNLAFYAVQIDDLPMYNADLEDERPASVNRFTAEIRRAHGVLIVTPEHNRSVPAVPELTVRPSTGSGRTANSCTSSELYCRQARAYGRRSFFTKMKSKIMSMDFLISVSENRSRRVSAWNSVDTQSSVPPSPMMA